MKKYIEKLQFITQDLDRYTHVNQAQLACEAGAKWIQYRCLTKSDVELLADINLIADICDDWGATLIVTAHLHLEGKADIQGFHIEDPNAAVAAIRRKLGDAYTLGSSANTFEDLIRQAQEGTDYVEFGPFNPASSWAQTYPLVDTADYQLAVEKLAREGISIPIVAVGGITLTDAANVLATGVHGIAISSAINQAEDLITAYQDFYHYTIS